MDELRIILLIAGVLLIAGLYVWGTYGGRGRAERDLGDVERNAPRITPDDDEAGVGRTPEFDAVAELERLQDARAAESAMRAMRADAPRSEFDDSPPWPPLDEDERGGAHDPVMDDDIPDVDDVDAIAAGRGLGSHNPIAAPGKPAGVRVEAPPLSGITANREEPEQLDLAGIGMSTKPGAGASLRAGGDELAIVVTVMAPEGSRFDGGDLRAALERVGMRYGEMRIFHRPGAGQPPGALPMFSAANIRKPGVFDLDTMHETHTTGVAMFMHLPGPPDPTGALEEMLAAARRLAEILGGQLCDETRSTLTTQSVNHLKERIAEFGRRQMLSRPG